MSLRFATCLAWATFGHAGSTWPVMAEGPDLSALVPIIEETFEDGLNRYDGRRGLWSTLPRRGVLMSNGPMSVFLDEGVLPSADGSFDPPLHVGETGLEIRAGRLSPEARSAVMARMRQSGHAERAAGARYYTGQINTWETWAQTYGYFEITAKMPRGKGYWPAFWLAHAGIGWPPEIDVVEAWGEGIAAPTEKDGQFNVAVYFDARDAEGEETLSVDLVNPFAAQTGGRRLPDVRGPEDAERYVMNKEVDAADELGADIYGEFWTYAALWTPESIAFFFGKDRARLREIYRTPTPLDLHEPMYVIANNQISSSWGWDPVPAIESEFLAPENAFVIHQITVMALRPDAVFDLSRGDEPDRHGDSVVRDTPGDDTLTLAEGLNVVELSGGADALHLVRPSGTASGNTIIRGFGGDDRVVLEGFPFDGVADAMARLTDVGEDVWLSSGADPVYPHTIIFRDATREEFSEAQVEVRWPITPDVWAADKTLSPTRVRDEDGDGKLAAGGIATKLDDGSGPVAIEGGPEGDIFYLYDAGSTVREHASGGVDTLLAFTDRRLPPNVEVGVAAGRGVNLVGGAGDDRLIAKAPGARLTGGAGDDLFVLGDAIEATVVIGPGDGDDHVVGLKSGDRVVLNGRSGIAADAGSISENGRTVVVALPGGGSVTFPETARAVVEAAVERR